MAIADDLVVLLRRDLRFSSISEDEEAYGQELALLSFKTSSIASRGIRQTIAPICKRAQLSQMPLEDDRVTVLPTRHH